MREGVWRRRSALLLAATILLASACASPQGGMTGAERDAMEARQLVERARLTVESFAADPVLGPDFKSLLARAHGAFVAPQVLKGAFILGASGGSGVLLARDEKGRQQWNGPAFYTLGGVSFGLQAGGESSEVVLLPMTERGVTALLAPSVKLGADIGVAAGPVGGGMAAATANLSADILSYARSKGLYAGISLAGAVVANRSDWNRAYYGVDVTATDILIRRTVVNPHAAPLIEAVVRASGG